MCTDVPAASLVHLSRPMARGHFQHQSLAQWSLHTGSLGKPGLFLRVLLGLGLGLGRQKAMGVTQQSWRKDRVFWLLESSS